MDIFEKCFGYTEAREAIKDGSYPYFIPMSESEGTEAVFKGHRLIMCSVLKLIRARLHMIAGRREDRLVFDLQTAVAESFGYETTREQRASEVLMRRYYWAAKAVTQLNQILILNIEERIQGCTDAPMRPINERFFDRGGYLEVASDDLYQRDRHAILATFLTLQEQDGALKGLSARTLRALYNARDLMDGAFRRDYEANGPTLYRIIRTMVEGWRRYRRDPDPRGRARAERNGRVITVN